MRLTRKRAWILVAISSAVLLASLVALSGWTAAAVAVGFFAALVALFKDEFWHWLHAPSVEVELEPEQYPSFGYRLVLRNPSTRLSADGVRVRVLELEPHPLEYSVGSKWSNHIIQVDRLVPRTSEETIFTMAPGAAVRIPLLNVGGAETDEDPATAHFPWWDGATTVAGDHGGLLVLPSINDRETYIDPYPELRPIEACPAMVRLEISGANVPARLYTVKITRDLEAWPREALPLDPVFHISTFSAVLESGSAPHNPAPHAGQLMPSDERPVREKPWIPLLEERRAAELEAKRRREKR